MTHTPDTNRPTEPAKGQAVLRHDEQDRRTIQALRQANAALEAPVSPSDLAAAAARLVAEAGRSIAVPMAGPA